MLFDIMICLHEVPGNRGVTPVYNAGKMIVDLLLEHVCGHTHIINIAKGTVIDLYHVSCSTIKRYESVFRAMDSSHDLQAISICTPGNFWGRGDVVVFFLRVA